jgi:hypothetical protein
MDLRRKEDGIFLYIINIDYLLQLIFHFCPNRSRTFYFSHLNSTFEVYNGYNCRASKNRWRAALGLAF